MAPSNPVRIVGCDSTEPSDPVRIVNFSDVQQLQQFDDLTFNTIGIETPLSVSDSLVSGVRRVSLNYGATTVNIQGDWYDLPAGKIVLNTNDVALPTTYNIYAWDTNGTTGVLVRSTQLNPETDPTVGYRYARIAEVRFSSVGGVATIFFVKRAFTSIQFMLHHIGEYDLYLTPRWFEGGALTVTPATGQLSTTFLEYTRLRFENFIDPITNGAILTDNELVTVANVEAVTTYADGSAITAGRYHKMLLGVVVGEDGRDFPFVIMRQGKPAVEYTTLDLALTDSEHVSATHFPDAYAGTILPLYYITMLRADASDLSLTDLRRTGIIGSGGGGTGGTLDHDALSNLGTTSHDKYILQDGSRALQGNMAANPGVTFDGVDVSAHAASPSAHHAPVTLNADADTILGLSTQQITLDTQTANRVLAGPTSGAAAIPTFRALVADDIPTTLIPRGELGVILANGVNNNIAIGTAAIIRVTGPTASFSVDGFAGGFAGRVLYVYNAAPQNMTANNEAGTSTAANRILTLGGASVTNGIGAMGFVYSAIDSRWILVSIRT